MLKEKEYHTFKWRTRQTKTNLTHTAAFVCVAKATEAGAQEPQADTPVTQDDDWRSNWFKPESRWQNNDK